MDKHPLQALLDELRLKHALVNSGGGQKKIEQQHEQGKLTARERIKILLDKDSSTVEIGALAADEMYEEYGGCPSAGVVVVLGYIHQRQCVVVANDATVKAGAWFPMTAKKNLRAQEIAMENRCLSSTWWTVRVYSCLCKTRSLLIRSILGVFFTTTPTCRPKVFCK
jgi:acetyl-CoA carboxylase carboxyltransferase component